MAAVCVLAMSACAAAPEATQEDPLQALGPTAKLSFVVVDAQNGKVLATQDADHPMPPASTAKVPTMLAALELLGPDYRFRTRVLATSAPDQDGILNGDLILADLAAKRTITEDWIES